MPLLSHRSIQRIGRAVSAVENLLFDSDGQPGRTFHNDDLAFFELAETLASNGNASAYFTYWDANNESYDVSESNTLIFSTTGKTVGGIGDWILCRPLGGNGRGLWEALYNIGGTTPTLVTGHAATDVNSSNATFYLNSVTAIQPGGANIGDCPGYDDNNSRLQVNNFFSWEIDQGGNVLAALNNGATSSPYYIAIQASCPAG